jgi:hypothetical protein
MKLLTKAFIALIVVGAPGRMSCRLMKRNFAVLLFFGFAVVPVPRNASGAASLDEQVKKLAERCKQIEAQLDRSVHYVRKTEANGATIIEQAWFNGAGDLIKVAIERTEPSGGELTEYSGDFFHREMFMLTRKESRLADGETQVDESRDYFSNDGDLIRKLTKNAHFKAGESTDTARIPNTVADLPKPHDPRTQEEREKKDEIFSKPEQIAGALETAGPPAFDPFTKVKGDSEKFRVIHRTVSPDGRYAIALGFARAQINWGDFVEKTDVMTGEPKEGSHTYTVRGEQDVRNYVVDLAQQKILGETGCDYFSTEPGPRPGFISCEVKWSPDSTKFVQEWEQKIYMDCVAGEIGPGPKIIGVVDLEKQIDKATSALVKKSQPAGVWIEVRQVNNGGEILIRPIVVSRAEDHEWEPLFTLSQKLQLRQTSSGLRVETVSVRRLPNVERK